MFDNINNQNQPNNVNPSAPKAPLTGATPANTSSAPSNFSQQNSRPQPDDIYAELDKPSQAPYGQMPVSNLNQMPPQENKKIMVLGGIVIGCLVIVVLGYFAVTKLLDSTSYDQINIESGEIINENKDEEVDTIGDEPAVAEPENEEQDNQLSEDEKDNDGDGLTNAVERTLGTNLNTMDSDGDGLFDEEEVNKYKTDPLSADTDGDGVLDGTEVKAGNDPNGPGKLFNVPGDDTQTTIETPQADIDTDGDGLLDNEEDEIGTDITRVDSDSDGLSDYEEFKTYKTNPLNPDSDGDTYLDGAEVKSGYNPDGLGKLNQ